MLLASRSGNKGRAGESRPAILMYEKLLKAITETFPEDATRPGLVLSYLERENQYYASIARYPTRGTKSIVTSAREDTLEKTIAQLGRNFLTILGRGAAIDALAQAVADSTGV